MPTKTKWDSRFFLTGAGVLSVMFMLDGDWLLLPLALAVLLWGARQADSERVARLMSGEGDADALSMLFEPRRSHSLLPLDHFTCRDLMFYRAGWPVYRFPHRWTHPRPTAWPPRWPRRRCPG